MDIDWSMMNSALVANNKLTFGIKGLFFPESAGEVDPSVPAPVMPAQDFDSSSKIQVLASDYMLNSLTQSLFKTNDFSQYGVWLNHTALPAGHPLELNTDALGLLFP
jgi:hypothetical protein